MTFSIDNPEGGLQQPPLGKYVWEKPSGEQGLKFTFHQIYSKQFGLKAPNYLRNWSNSIPTNLNIR